MNKKLYKSNTNKMICGVCGGLGEFFGIDPTIIRLFWAILGLAVVRASLPIFWQPSLSQIPKSLSKPGQLSSISMKTIP